MIALVFIYGLVVGSFLNVCIFRIPEGISVISPPSSCSSCGHRLYFRDMIPVVSYIANKGKCRYCNVSYSVQYPIIELLNAVLYLMIALKYGWSFYAVVYCILASMLITVSLIDIKYMIIPDVLNVVIAVIGVAVILYDNSFIWDKFIGSAVGLLIFSVLAFFTGSMGGGDIKLMTVLGLIFGVKGILFITVFSFFIGALVSAVLIAFKVKSMKDKIPFGPFICMAALLFIFYGNEIIESYIRLFVY
jgi:leader peptidase (prepilin peptidase)/N-methyltransferase